MVSKFNVTGHPLHPLLVPIPIGLWVFSLACDIIRHATGNAIWGIVAWYSIAGGVIGALVAAVPGLIDLYYLPPSQAKKIGLWHMAINLSLVTMYVLNFLWRRNVGSAPIGPFILSIVAVILLLASGWLGGEMVFRHGVGVLPVDELTSHEPLEREHKGLFGLKLHHRH